jgi:catechol 2,3-dioxygenase-like lactoylglutathione lyase family enzyme
MSAGTLWTSTTVNASVRRGAKEPGMTVHIDLETTNPATDRSELASATPPGSRVQLALNVRDIEAAVAFYRKLFGREPAKRRPGYANFAIASPPLKLVLIEDPTARGDGVTGALNHLGVEVASSAEVNAASRRLTGEGLTTLTQDTTNCCYALQDKVWVHDPDGAPWEVYTVLSDAPSDADLAGARGTSVEPASTAACCTDVPPARSPARQE